jgi:hypothetical protein
MVFACISVSTYDNLSPVSSIDPYVVPREMGLMRAVDSKSDLTVLDLVQRIQVQRSRFNQKYVNKRAAEDAFYAQKYQLPPSNCIDGTKI